MVEVEVTILDLKLNTLINNFEKYSNCIFYDGMILKLEKIKVDLDDIQRAIIEYEENKEECIRKLDQIKANLVKTEKTMLSQIPSWGLSVSPLNEEEYVNGTFYSKIGFLLDLVNYLVALREKYLPLLGKYFALESITKTEINALVSLYEWPYNKQCIWESCFRLRLQLYNFECALANILDNK